MIEIVDRQSQMNWFRLKAKSF